MNENHAQLLLSRDAILGLHLATRDQADAPVQRVFASLDKVEEAFGRGEIPLEATIEVRVQGKRVRTTVGRALVARCLPETGIPDVPLQRTSVHALLEALCVSHGLREAVRASRDLEALGLSIVAQGGLSLGMDDLAPAEGKKALVAEARARVEGFAESVAKGTSSDHVRSEDSADAWVECAERVWKATTEPQPAPRHDLLFSLVNAQAAGKQEHLRRTLAMPKGMWKPNGYSVELPAVSSLGEGLSAHEHFFDARNIRATTVRTQGRRLRAAAIERRLYRALRGVKPVEDDCGTTDGLRVTAAVEVGRVVRTVRAQAEGLIAAEPVCDRFGTVRLPRGARIEGAALDDVTEVWVRWPYACRSRGGVCRVCSGGRTGLEAARALSAAAAVLPAEFLFFVGSYCGRPIPRRDQGIRTRTAGLVTWHDVVAEPVEGGFRVIALGGHITIVNVLDARVTERYAVYPGQVLPFADGAQVEFGACVVDDIPWQRPTLAMLPPDACARLDFDGLVLDSSTDSSGSFSAYIRTPKPVHVWLRAVDGNPSWSPQRIELVPRATLVVPDQGLVRRGDVIAWTHPEGRVLTDSDPSLTSLEALVEPAVAPVDRAIFAPRDGIVHVDRARSCAWITTGASKRAVRIHDLARLEVQTGDWVVRGDAIAAGKPSPHDQLRVRGSEWLAASLAERLMREFGLERDATSLLHVGQLVRAMLSRVRVVRPQGTRLRKGATVTREVLEAANVEASLRGRAPAVVMPVLTPLSVLGR